MNPDPTVPTPPSLSTLKANAEKALSNVEYLMSERSFNSLKQNIRAYLDALERENVDAKTSLKLQGESWCDAMDEQDKLRKRIAELERGCQEPKRFETCKLCGNKVSDWVDPDWAHGRICRKCESAHEPTLTFSDALRIARGCHHALGSRCDSLHCKGIQTVINALEAASKS